MNFKTKGNELMRMKKLSKDFALEKCDEILSIINIIPHLKDDSKTLFKERNPLYSKWIHSFCVINEKNVIIGILLAYYREKDEIHPFDSLYIHRLAVRKQYQNQGIGKKMLNYFLYQNLYLKKEFKLISIQTNKENNNQYVIDFYNKTGFRDVKLIEYSDKLDILMAISKCEYLKKIN